MLTIWGVAELQTVVSRQMLQHLSQKCSFWAALAVTSSTFLGLCFMNKIGALLSGWKWSVVVRLNRSERADAPPSRARAAPTCSRCRARGGLHARQVYVAGSAAACGER